MEEREREPYNPEPSVAVNAEGDGIVELESAEGLPMGTEDHWKVFFDQFDPANTGYISTEKFRNLLQAHSSELEPHKLEVLLALADNNSEGMVCYQDFVNLMSNKRSNSFCRAIHLGNHRLRANSLLEETGLTLSQRFIRHIAYETLPRGLDRKWYYDSYTCCPPPWFMITVTILEIAIFVYYGLVLEKWVLQITHPSYLNNPLVYQPQLRSQVWRYLSYIFIHVGVEHLGFNVVLQLLVGVPLEMVHGALRISFVYLAGVLAELVGNEMSIQTDPDGNSNDLHESGVWPCCLAEISSTCPPSVYSPQLRYSPWWSDGGNHAGGGGPQELRAETS
ncbi:rhomboid-related protein 3 isoform X2 [Carcharodon carcharias]|uniref:rhomboid-related protein 3 isoform X2 n=1 Tax=Carcharodon carcharias TaxID=13397 RepID=UPI001B7E4A6F|nr:rhomboid-related protein 3 isoform X2 [Carcharodon carcharias]